MAMIFSIDLQLLLFESLILIYARNLSSLREAWFEL